MTERRKDILLLLLMFGIMLIFFGKILFTDKIIRAPDIINEFYWGVDSTWGAPFWETLKIPLSAPWNLFINGGFTDLGGNLSVHFHFYRKLIFLLIPPPASVAWFIVLHLYAGAVGVYCYCRLLSVSRIAAILAALIFALAPETASLINAGHVIKIATICFAPWGFWSLENGFQSRRPVWFMATSMILAFQFFGGHWQIAFYTCLAIGCYAIIRSGAILCSTAERKVFPLPKLFGMNLLVLVFFLTTVTISLVPLANWSTDTNRGVQSGANQGKGGLEREEAMSWSLPPEELGALVIPGFFGLSRQEAGANPPNIASYYWGRMVFTQTASYMGLIPWLLLPLPLIFRRDKYTWLALAGITCGLLFSMGKYTPFYQLLYDYFPGINRFRVPKMMMFIPLLGLSVLAARGLDLFMDEKVRSRCGFRNYLLGILAFSLGMLTLWGSQLIAQRIWLDCLAEMITEPNRFEQGPQLIAQRWKNLVRETGIAAYFAAGYGAVVLTVWKRWLPAAAALALIFALFLGDLWRVDDKFMFLVPSPETSRGKSSPVTDFLVKAGDQYRTLPMQGTDPMFYVAHKIPVLFTSNPVQKRRWQEYLDNLSIMSGMADIMNLRYLVFSAEQYSKDKASLAAKYQLVFTSPDGKEVVVENRNVMPKAWLVPAVLQSNNPQQTLSFLQSPQFDPRRIAFVESPPPLALDGASGEKGAPGDVTVKHYEGERIALVATARFNALLVLGEKFDQGWKATVDGKTVPIVPVNHVLRGVYLPQGNHQVEFTFDPTPFKIGKWFTLGSFALFAVMLVREIRPRRVKRQLSTN